jgi:iron complex outermembrane receptor protein
MHHHFAPTALSLAIASALATMALAFNVHAADVVNADPVIVNAKSGNYRSGDKDSAAAVAPTQASLDATQPQSIITREFIEKSIAPTAEYSRVVNVAPSVSGDSANGPGLSETKTTMRGFTDDQYNITFDGIPWGDTNNPAHHSTSFFPASVIGSAVVDRGPGNASDVGFATFGGSINLFSKKAGAEASTSVFGSIGNWNTRLIGVSHETGRLADWGQATLQFNLQHLESDGNLSLNKIKSDNLTLKFERPLGDSSLLTAFASANVIKYVQPDNNKGPTLAQVALYGKNFSLNNDPTSFNYAGYNHTAKNTDFDYIRLQSNWSSAWATDARIYTYAYDNQTISSTDPTGATAPGTKVGAAGNKDIPGIDKQNQYRVYGSIVKATRQFDAGALRVGAWIEKSDTDRHQYDIDLSLGNIRDPRETKPTPLQLPSVLFDQQSTIKTVQPFAEFEWQPLKGLTLTPGIKSVSITRSVDAVINQKTRLPFNGSVDYRATLPFLTVNHQFTPTLAAYAQFAKGFQIPDLNTFYITDPTHNSAEPQKSTNYQIGIVNKTANLVWDADVYQIDFKNKYVSNGLAGAAQAFLNVGGATYKGVEGQVTYVVTPGFAVYGNGSINHASANDTGKTISNAPNMTAALGTLLSSGPWSASFVFKRTGANYQQDYATNPATYDYYRVAAYNNADLGVSYLIANPGAGVKSLKLQANVFNLFDKQGAVAITPGKTVAFDQYVFQAPRSLQLSAKADF